MNNENFTVNTVGHISIVNGQPVLQLKPEFASALTGLEGFSHINVLWWCHLYDEYREVLVVDKPYVNGPEQMGIFATRSPVRPNPIALSTVKVTGINVEQGTINLAYIDAEDGTPVLDLKPYYPCEDRVRNADTPEWNSHWPQYLEESANFDWSAEFANAQ